MKQSLTLFDTEETVLKTLKKDDMMDIESISKSTQLDNAQINSIAFSLQEKGLVQIVEDKCTFIFLSDEGKKYAAVKLPEIRLLHYLCKVGAQEITTILQTQDHGMEKAEVTIGLNWLKKKKWVELKKQQNGTTLLYVTETGKDAALDPCCEEEFLSLLAKSDLVLEEMPSKYKDSYLEFRKRKLLKEKEITTRKLQLTELGIKVAAGEVQIIKEVSKLTRDDITSGRWKSVVLKPYNVTASPPTVYLGKKQPFLEFLEEVRRAVIGMGFQEAKGPLIEMEFWNFDALFQAQDHPAREIHDTYYLKDPIFGDLELDDLRKRVKATHENGWTTGSRGWRYPWSLKRASRLILRSQTTSVSMRFLHEHKTPPLKMFCLDRNFRPDVLDATHAIEFFQLEGIVGDKSLTLKHHLGYLKQIVIELIPGAEVKFKPGYFPFTEPSVEVFARHPKLGWIEVGGSGIFRPEVVKPFNVDFQVLAWGIGIARLAMIYLEYDDIRDLYSDNLDLLRTKEVR